MINKHSTVVSVCGNMFFPKILLCNVKTNILESHYESVKLIL